MWQGILQLLETDSFGQGGHSNSTNSVSGLIYCFRLRKFRWPSHGLRQLFVFWLERNFRASDNNSNGRA